MLVSSAVFPSGGAVAVGGLAPVQGGEKRGGYSGRGVDAEVGISGVCGEFVFQASAEVWGSDVKGFDVGRRDVSRARFSALHGDFSAGPVGEEFGYLPGARPFYVDELATSAFAAESGG